MAGRLGPAPSTSAPTTMIVTNTPGTDLAFTNFAYCSAADLRKFSVSQSKLVLAFVGDSVVLSLRFVPPDDFNLALLMLELEFVKAKGKNEQIDAVLLAQQLRKRFIDQVLEQLNVFHKDHIDTAAKALNNMPIKKLYMLVEMAAKGRRVEVQKLFIQAKRRLI